MAAGTSSNPSARVSSTAVATSFPSSTSSLARSRSFWRTAKRAATAIARARSCGVPAPEASPSSSQWRASSSSPEADQYRSSFLAMTRPAAAPSGARAKYSMAARRFACSRRSRRSQSGWCGPHASSSNRETSSAYQRGVPLLHAVELAVLLGPLEPELPDVGEHAVPRVAGGGLLGEDDRLVDECAHQVENLVRRAGRRHRRRPRRPPGRIRRRTPTTAPRTSARAGVHRS